jgi:hypothetical protein
VLACAKDILQQVQAALNQAKPQVERGIHIRQVRLIRDLSFAPSFCREGD